MKIISATALAGELTGFARKRFDRFTPTSIPDLFSDAGEFVELPETFLHLLAEHRSSIRAITGRWLEEIGNGIGKHPILEFLSYNTRRYLKNNDQFLGLSPGNRHDLNALYVRFLRSFQAMLGAASSSRLNDSHLREDAAGLLAGHRLNLREFVLSLDIGKSTLRGEGPHCSEYSATLQTGVLHLGRERILSPVLDIGCGEEAALVRHLRARGVQAFGIDRFAPIAEYLFRHDWLTFPLGEELWGTIISHMAFSHHFLHHHLKGSDEIRTYAARYMDVLGALKPGGSFIYSPGLPFIEKLLPRERYQVKSASVPGSHDPRFDAALAGLLGESTFYAAHVRKIAR